MSRPNHRQNNAPAPPPPSNLYRFPNSWLWFVDEALPQWTKDHYSPKDSWKDKPFTETDARFFLRGIRELSELFTEETGNGMPVYLTHAKYRSSYLFYFLPLQAAKFITIFQMHPGAIQAALAHGVKTGTMRVKDYGAGPGTATLALLLLLLDPAIPAESLPAKIEIDWVDENFSIMKDGRDLANLICTNFSRLRDRVKINLIIGDWESEARKPSKEESSLVLFGHVLNESSRGLIERFPDVFAKMSGGGMLVVEPAHKTSSQLVSQLRDRLLQESRVEAKPESLWGPCLHAGGCPLAEGRDWCHFSVRAKVPGKWFAFFSKGLSSEKEWLKFAYVWIAAKDYPAPIKDSKMRLAVSDPLSGKNREKQVLLCEPETPGRLPIGDREVLHRGDQINPGMVAKGRLGPRRSER